MEDNYPFSAYMTPGGFESHLGQKKIAKKSKLVASIPPPSPSEWGTSLRRPLAEQCTNPLPDPRGTHPNYPPPSEGQLKANQLREYKGRGNHPMRPTQQYNFHSKVRCIGRPIRIARIAQRDPPNPILCLDVFSGQKKMPLFAKNTVFAKMSNLSVRQKSEVRVKIGVW